MPHQTFNILILGASYGSLLAIKFLAAGHHVTMTCRTANCHGEIAKMEVVQQRSSLTMGWCIDCHRKTNVNAKGNAYYDKLVELHNSENKEPLKVQDIGGLECSKCHY